MRIQAPVLARFLFSALAIVSVPGDSRALTIDQVERSVLVSAFVDASGVFTDTTSDGVASTSPGAFVEAAVDGVGFGDITNATGEASQDSTILSASPGTLLVDAGGATGAIFDVNDPGFPSRAQASADSSLSILFTVDAPSAFTLSAAVSAELAELTLFGGTARASAEVLSEVELRNAAGDVFFSIAARDTAADDGAVLSDASVSGVLAPDTYWLEILARSDLRGFEDASGFGTSGYGVRLEIVPEPGTALLLGLGLAWLARRDQRTVGPASWSSETTCPPSTITVEPVM